jgi:peptidyl-dipeptidase Dcp
MNQHSLKNNPFLIESSLPFGAFPFNDLKDEHFKPAFEQAIQKAKDRLSQIVQNPEAPTFQNTIEAIEFSTDELNRVHLTFSNLSSADTNDVRQKLAKEFSPQMAEFLNDLLLDAGLFDRVKVVYEKKDELDFDKENATEQKQLLEKTYRSFARNGALLDDSQKKKLREIDRELSIITEQFQENVLKSSNAFELLVRKEEELEGLPSSAIEAARVQAKEKGHDKGWVFTLSMPSYFPFMRYSSRRELREKMWRAYLSQATEEGRDNRPLILKLVQLRDDRAKLLGYETHADFVLSDRMASSISRVDDFLDRLLGASKEAAKRDLEEVERLRKEIDGFEDALQPWDYPYYSRILKERKYQFDDEALRPYFPLHQVVDGLFEHARKLFQLTFRKRKDIPVYCADVEVFEVRDEEKDDFLGLLYLDFFPRTSKKSGAWMTLFQEQGFSRGEMRRPHVSLVCNFTKPTEGKPSLLTLGEVQTAFHEFGHALHGLLSQCQYTTLAGPNVYWDFVELPSQMMENWVHEKEGLDLFARHYETGEPISDEWVKKIRASQLFQAGYASLRQVSFARLDMAWHRTPPSQMTDVEEFERLSTEASTFFQHVSGAAFSPSFLHIFAGGYSAGYYSYKWAEVLDADAFELFKEKGIFNQEVSRKFKDTVLARGGSEHPMELYRRFRGREPDPDALLRRDGLIPS